MRLLIRIEADDVEKGCFMVVFRDTKQSNQLIGIPLRGVSKKEANDAKDSLKYAFEYGYRAARDEIQQHMNRMSVTTVEPGARG